MDLNVARWRRSSFSGGEGGGNDNCVEVAYLGQVAVRDSKNTGEALTFPPTAWHSLVSAQK